MRAKLKRVGEPWKHKLEFERTNSPVKSRFRCAECGGRFVVLKDGRDFWTLYKIRERRAA